jgi:putative alpha-1,2-mannosidase
VTVLCQKLSLTHTYTYTYTVFAQQAMQIAFDTSVLGYKAGRAQKWLRQSLDLFKPATNMYPGDEDNGSMGAWYVLNALGIYPLSPASGDYVIGSPQFANVTITLGNEEEPSSFTHKLVSQKKKEKKHQANKVKATTSTTSSSSLTISASNQGPNNVYVQSVTWNGEAIEGTSISYATMMAGGTLHFVMGSEPATSPP